MSSNSELAEEIEVLKAALASRDEQIEKLKKKVAEKVEVFPLPEEVQPHVNLAPVNRDDGLMKEDIERYSRQIILPELKVSGQRKLKASSALVVGCGGLGCPAAAYLAAAGVGRIGLVDHDTVEVSNLQRQVLHTTDRLGQPKARSLAAQVKALNPLVRVVPYSLALTSSTAVEILRQFDVVLDCTDNVATRYLLSDAAVLTSLPLVSGSALRWEGQLTVYNYAGGPTYRCLYPSPPPPEAVTNCSDGGVLGPVPGVIGVLQALETLKILAGLPPAYSGSLFLFDGLEGRARVVKLRGRREEADVKHLIDYEQFCGAKATDKDSEREVLGQGDRVSVHHLAQVRREGGPHLLVDVRLGVEVDMCGLEGSLNLPLGDIQGEKANQGKIRELLQPGGRRPPLYCICRRGNDSQTAVRELRQILPESEIRDVVGGLHAWAKHIDPLFPVY